MKSTIDNIIRNRARSVLVVCSAIQVLLVFLVMGYLGVQDASNRAAFLAKSNNNSIGLMIKTGDMFQLKNVLKSFKNESTPFAFILDETGQSILETIDDEIYETTGLKRFEISPKHGLLLATKHNLIYNGNRVGTLILKNRIRPNDWIVICALITLSAITTFAIQSHFLKEQSLQIGRSMTSLADVFHYTESEDSLKTYKLLRIPSNIDEVDGLGEKIFNMLSEIISSKKTEKEAAVGRIIAQVSHDMRAPLGVFESILDSPPEKVSLSYGIVREALYRLNAMIESLRNSDVESIITKAIAHIDYDGAIGGLRKRASARNISIDLAELVKDEVLMDSPKLERAWVNLVSNAIDAAQSLVRIIFTKDGFDLILQVCDDGPGVPDEFLPRLFQRGATLGKPDGTGLGLAYVKQIMQGHGGDVVYRRENGLTIFECHLPNAVIGKEEKAMELSQRTEMNLKQIAPKLVSICVEPPSVAKEILAILSSRTSSKFTFSGNYSFGETDVLVTNNPELAAQILEEDGEVEIAEYQPNLSQELLKTRILRRFEG